MHCQTNRHRVAELADRHRQMSQIEERIEELREVDEIINNVQCLSEDAGIGGLAQAMAPMLAHCVTTTTAIIT
jgi:hypothetical protein